MNEPQSQETKNDSLSSEYISEIRNKKSHHRVSDKSDNHDESEINFLADRTKNSDESTSQHLKNNASLEYTKHTPIERDIDTETHSSHMRGTDTVIYMNGEALSRPLRMPAKYKRLSVLLILAATIIGAGFLTFYFDKTYNEPIRQQQAMEEQLEKDVPLDLPDLISLIPMDDATILATLNATGETLYEKSAGTAGTPLEIIKLPQDVSLTDAAAMYLTGINKLSAAQAALLLNGSWDLDVDRSKGTNISIHYADFKSKTISSAIQQAMETEKLNETQLAESGEDESGNTFSSGNVTVNGTVYAWRISALPLSEIYSIKGLPEDAIYVGIRITS